jgi:hypothetical protein
VEKEREMEEDLLDRRFGVRVWISLFASDLSDL